MAAAATASSSTNGSAAPKVNGNGTKVDAHRPRVSKNAKRRAKKKEEKAAAATTTASTSDAKDNGNDEANAQPSTSSASVSASADGGAAATASLVALPSEDDETFAQFKDIFSKFSAPLDDDAQAQAGPSSSKKGDVIYSDDEDMSDSQASDKEDSGASAPISKRKQKKLSRLTVAELKQLVKKPEVVDWSDVNAADPTLLVHIKSTRNTVPVPAHWSQKRDYLQNKRGIEKPPFELPAYIAETGIGTMKDAINEKEAEQSLKTKTRERVQPKMGKVVVDYQKLHDAFFRFQTKPPLSSYGETYYEGKEYETKFKERKPGSLSQELKEALSIPPLAPPPWLIAQQRFGPPPSYPFLPIPGLNAPIPDGAQWGFHPGGWGRPPLDEYGNPLYGDVLGAAAQAQAQGANYAAAAAAAMIGEAPAQREPWGELEPEEDEPEESEDEEEEEEDEEEEDGGEPMQQDDGEQDLPADGLETPGGMQSVASTIPSGLETPDFIELRKQGRGGTATPAMQDMRPQSQRSLYQVLPETQTRISGLMGSERGYDLSGGPGRPPANAPVLGAEDSVRAGSKRSAGKVEVALDPSELEGMSEQELQQRYDAARATRGVGSGADPGSVGGGEDLSLLREELSRKRRQTEERRREKGSRGGGDDAGGKGGKFKF